MKNKPPITFIIVASALMAAIIIVTALGRGFALGDFKVYYGAAQSFFGGGPVYGISYATTDSFFKYAPVTALMAGPFLLLPYSFAIVLQYIILSIVSVLTLILAFNLINTYLFDGEIKSPNAVLLLVMLCFLQHLVREVTVGNVNMPLLLLLCLCLRGLLQKQFVLAGILLGLVLMFKPFFVLLLVPLVLHKYYKTLLATIATMAVLAIVPAFFVGFIKDIQMHQQWISTMLTHSGSFYSPNTLDILIRNYIYSNLPGISQYIILFAVCVLYVVLFYSVKRSKTESLTHKDLILEWFLLIALMPSLFRTDTQHFLFSMPLLAIGCCYLFISRNKAAIVLFVITVLLYDGNSYDIWGRDLSNRFYNMGILGISNLIIVAFTTIIYFKGIRENMVVSN